MPVWPEPARNAAWRPGLVRHGQVAAVRKRGRHPGAKERRQDFRPTVALRLEDHGAGIVQERVGENLADRVDVGDGCGSKADHCGSVMDGPPAVALGRENPLSRVGGEA